MSFEAMTWATNWLINSDTTPPVASVLVMLANRADPEGFCYPSLKYLCERTKFCERTVRAAIKELERLGLLAVTRPGGKQNNYSLTMEPPATPAPDAGPPRQALPVTPAPDAAKTKDRQKEQTKGYEPSSSVLDWAARQGLDYRVHLEYFRNYITQPKNAKKYTDLDAAFRNCMLADWGNLRKNFRRVDPRNPGPGKAVM